MQIDLSIHGGLTVVPMPHFEKAAEQMKLLIEHRGTKTDIASPRFRTHGSGETGPVLGPEHIDGHDVVVLASGPGTPEMRVQLEDLLAYLEGHHAQRICVMFGYMPLSRSDTNEGTDILALFGHYVRTLRNAGGQRFERIIAADLHCAQEVNAGPNIGFITEVTLMRRLLVRAINVARTDVPDTHICFVFTDEGSHKRYEDVLFRVEKEIGLHLPIVIGIKRRDDSYKVNFEGFYGNTDLLASSVAICVDDEIASAGTLLELIKKAENDHGKPKSWRAAIVHGIFCGQALARLTATNCPIDKIHTTNTIPFGHRQELAPLISEGGRVDVLCWLEELSQLIRYYHDSKTIHKIR